MSDPFAQMRVFAAVVEHGGFSAAARRLGMTQSAVSKQVAGLEARLGTRLLSRTTRSVTPTENGAIYLVYARAAVEAVERADAALVRRDPLAGGLVVTAPPTLGIARLMAIIAEFLAAFPQITIASRFTDALVDLGDGGIDLAVRVGRQIPGAGFARHIGTTRRVIVASPVLLDRVGRPAAPADLALLPCCRYSRLASGGIWQFASGEGVAVSGPFDADNPEVLRIAALAGVGLVLSARWLFEADIAAGRLEEVLPGHPPQDMPIHLIAPVGIDTLSPRAQCFADFVADAFARDPLLAP